MTDTHFVAPSPRASATSPDYQKTLRVKAGPDAVFDALTTASGLSAWWTRATGSGETGGELAFFMNTPEPLLIRVDRATRPTFVHWTVTDCPFLTDWVGTRLTFTVEQVDEGSELHFRHHGLTAALDCIEMCTRGWDHFLPSLSSFVEVGHGSPVGSEGDRARRSAEATGPRAEVTSDARRP